MRETIEQRNTRWQAERAESIAPYEGREDAVSVMACLRAMGRQLDKEIHEETHGVFLPITERWATRPASGHITGVLLIHYPAYIAVEEHWHIDGAYGTDKYRIASVADDRVLSQIPDDAWRKWMHVGY